MPQTYPDISHLLAAKVQRRRALAALSWEEKVAIITKMRALLPKGAWKGWAEVRPRSTPEATSKPVGEIHNTDYVSK